MRRLVIIVALLLLGSCAAKVGDACEVNTDCGNGLSCDQAQPEGYCTASPCQTNECPDEAVCVDFKDGSSFCMLRCEKGGDCRDGYVCVDNYGDAPFCNGAPFLN